MNKYVFILVALISTTITSQTPDVFRSEYMFMPKNEGLSKLSRVKLVTNVPIKVKDSNLLVLGAEYNFLSYNLQREDIKIGEKGTANLHVIDLNIAYVYRYNKDWRFIGVITPRIASTLRNPIENGDFGINATLGFFRDRPKADKPTRLILGVAYNTSIPIRVPLPIVYYEKRFHDKWSYVVGVPKSGFKYHYNDKHMLQTEFILDGYFVNLQNGLLLPGGGLASYISSAASLATVGYQYNFTKIMSVYGYMGHTLFQTGVLRDEERNDIFILNNEPSFYFRAGFRIGL